MAQKTTLEITRPNTYIAMMIPHKIFVDDQKVGEVRNGQTQTIDVNAGTHNIQVRQSAFVKSNILSLECLPDQTIRLQVRQNNPLLQVLWSMIPFGVFSLKRRDNLRLERLAE